MLQPRYRYPAPRRKGNTSLSARFHFSGGAIGAVTRWAAPRPLSATSRWRSVNAAAVVQSEILIRDGQTPTIDPALFKDKYVFFGFSAPAKVLDEKLGFTAASVCNRVLAYLADYKAR